MTRILVKWIADEYHQTPHRGLQMMTPVEKWTAGLPDIQIELPAYPQQLEVITGSPRGEPVLTPTPIASDIVLDHLCGV
ncbi:hypothetical protein WS63_17560 [Burkholderia stagnalis]|nr:hypothetical protein WS63_17560 [Burkholderia stagnalis]